MPVPEHIQILKHLTPGHTQFSGWAIGCRPANPAGRCGRTDTWNLGLHGVQLEHIRGDRVLQDALSVRADPLHLARAFGLSSPTAIDYSEIARSLMPRPLSSRSPTTEIPFCFVAELFTGDLAS